MGRAKLILTLLEGDGFQITVPGYGVLTYTVLEIKTRRAYMAFTNPSRSGVDSMRDGLVWAYFWRRGRIDLETLRVVERPPRRIVIQVDVPQGLGCRIEKIPKKDDHQP